MKANEVKIGGLYIAKVTNKLATVRIDSKHSKQGWNATNTATGKRIHIKSPQRLRERVGSDFPGLGVAGKPKPADGAASKMKMRATAKADQENAAKRDERAAAPDGMTASERAMTASEKRGKAAGKAALAKQLEEAKAALPKPAAKPAEAKPAKRMSALDAAAKVLAGGGQMNCKQLVEEMGKRGLWTSPGGKTPDATLYSAIIREIKAKGSEARFEKVDRGQFVANRKAVQA